MIRLITKLVARIREALGKLLMTSSFIGDEDKADKADALAVTLLVWVAPIFLALLGQTVDWGVASLRGKPVDSWWATMWGSVFVWIAVGLGTFFVFAQTVYHGKRLEQLANKLSGETLTLENAAARLKETAPQIRLFRMCADTFNLIARSNFMNPEHLEQVGPAALQASQAWAANMAAWYKRAFESADPVERRLWLSHASTYFTQEAFDVYRGEIVTNGRNYTLLRVSTLATLLENATKDEVVVSCLVSPLHPKDWYNTPLAAGRSPVKSYSDAGFPNLFHRSLRELLHSVNTVVDGAMHVRLLPATLLLAADKASDPRFGWDLENETKLRKDLKDYQLLPVSVRPVDCDSYSGVFDKQVKQIGKYYESLNASPFAREHSSQIPFTPMFSRGWPDALKNKKVPTDWPALIAAQEVATIRNADLSDLSKAIVALARIPANNALRLALSLPELSRLLSSDRFAPLASLVGSNTSGAVQGFDAVLRSFHEMSLAHAPCAGDPTKKDPVHGLLLAWLRVRELEREGLSYRSLGEVFAGDLHVDPRHARVHVVGEDDVPPEWVTRDQLSALMVFGFINRSDLTEAGNIEWTHVRWKAAIGARLHYAYDAVTIRFIDRQNWDTYGELIGKYWGDRRTTVL